MGRLNRTKESLVLRDTWLKIIELIFEAIYQKVS